MIIMEASIKLFKCLPISQKDKKIGSEKLYTKTLKRGFIFAPEVIANYSEQELLNLFVGIDFEKFNNSFHKSWKKIRNSSREELVIEQILHYFSTYGMTRLGLYKDESIYVPQEKLEIPNINLPELKIIIIKGITKKELSDKIYSFLQSGIALKEETINDCVEILDYVGIDENKLNNISNKEVKTILYSTLDIIPESPTEFLRLFVYKTTDKTLLIKNPKTINAIKDGKTPKTQRLLKKYINKYGIENLSKIFYRYKPIFLALRGDSSANKMINKIRKLAPKYHVPYKKNYMDKITEHIKNHTFNESIFKKELKNTTIFKKIKLAYALKYRTINCESIVYRIRNGRAFATNFEFKQKRMAKHVLDLVLKSIASDLNLKNKNVFIPNNVNYALPATEKQFVGNFPVGTNISVKDNMVFGCHWFNTNERIIDLDLSLISADSKIGWDSHYKSEDNKILFSGDVTSAPKPKGASELFYINKNKPGTYLMNINYFNYCSDVSVPSTIFVASEEIGELENNYMVNPNNIVGQAMINIKNKESVVGLVDVEDSTTTFYFINTSIGNNISSSVNEETNHSINYFLNYYKNSILLKEILTLAGTKFVANPKDAEIDLSQEKIDKSTFIDLLYNANS